MKAVLQRVREAHVEAEGRTVGRTRDDYLLLLEHPHTYTVGRNGDGSNLVVSAERLKEVGAELHHVDRGGDITYHHHDGMSVFNLSLPKAIVEG